jgi:hypothetical protein
VWLTEIDSAAKTKMGGIQYVTAIVACPILVSCSQGGSGGFNHWGLIHHQQPDFPIVLTQRKNYPNLARYLRKKSFAYFFACEVHLLASQSYSAFYNLGASFFIHIRQT